MPANPPIVNFDDEDGQDDASAMQEACRNLQRFAWDANDLKFTFQKLEIKMSAVGVKKQYTKFQVLSTVIPKAVEDEVKSMLCKQEAEYPDRNAYKLLKTEIFRIFGPRPEASIDRALSRVLVGKPSQLARALVGDICKTELVGCDCCPDVVSALWKRQIPADVRSGIAHMQFNKANFQAICKLADDIFDSNRPASGSAFSVAAVSGAGAGVAAQAPPPSFLNETQPGLDYPVPEVSAVSRGGRGGRRPWRGNRGGRGGQRGGAQASQSGGGSAPAAAGPKHKGTPHPDLPAGTWQGCSMHFKFGRGAFFCAEPSTCPWKNVFAPRPQK